MQRQDPYRLAPARTYHPENRRNKQQKLEASVPESGFETFFVADVRSWELECKK